MLPKLSLANNMYLGESPPFFKDLTIIEQSAISRCFIQAVIIKISTETLNQTNFAQLKMKGNIITFPQNPDNLLTLLPNIPTAEYFQIAFVGTQKPCEKRIHKLFRVRRNLIQQTLIWLKKNNPLYKNVEIIESLMETLPLDDIPATIKDHFTYIDIAESKTIKETYDNINRDEFDVNSDISYKTSGLLNSADGIDMEFYEQLNVIKNIYNKTIENSNINENKLFISINHNNEPVSEIKNNLHLMCAYPTLFPYGIGGLDAIRAKKVSYREHVTYLLQLDNDSFRTHPSFQFIVSEIIFYKNCRI